MKHLKKLSALLIALVMVLSMGVMAWADTPVTTGTLTINDTRTGRTYVAYQIVTGDVSGTEGSTENPLTLANLKWGKGQTTHTAGTRLTETEINGLPASDADRAAITTYLESLTLTTVSNDIYTSTAGSGVYTFTNIPAGWYVIKETTNTVAQDDFTSAFLVEVIGAATATPKGSKTTVEKKVDDINDSDSSIGAWTEKDSADYDIGDDIVYTLTATLGDDLTDYTSYKLVFTDNLSVGLTYKELVSVTVKHGETSSTKENNVVNVADGTWGGTGSAYTNGSVKTFTINDVLASTVGATAGDQVIIKYKATLNENAVIGSAGNPNKVYLEFSNNPGTTELGKTPEDINVVFTYKAVFDKYTTQNSVKKHLSGAEFTLLKVTSDITDAEVAALTGNETAGTNKVVKIFSAVKSAGKYTDETAEVAGSVFTFNGLDDGVYVLVETSTPAGFNTAANKKFVVTATHSEENANPQLLTFTGNMTTGIVDAEATTASDNGTNVLSAEILNEKGSVLPSTGGIGRRIFIVSGSILLVGAAILLITRRRMSAR